MTEARFYAKPQLKWASEPVKANKDMINPAEYKGICIPCKIHLKHYLNSLGTSHAAASQMKGNQSSGKVI